MKSNSLKINHLFRFIVAFTLFTFQSNFIYAAPIVNALPQGAVTVHGVTYFNYNGHVLGITASNNSIINWNSFNIGEINTVNFFQPNSSSVVLNRVVGIDPSYIYGALNANGRIFLVDPNGIFFGPNSQVNANAIAASTLDISNNDFLAGNYTFSQHGKPNAWIINQGKIHVTNGGYVLLLSDAINNSGLIEAKLGRVLLAAGEKMTVALDDNSDISVTIDDAVSNGVFGPDGNAMSQAIKNSGKIIANGGTILLNAKILNGIFNNAVNNTGLIQANSIVNNNGTIEIVADGGNIVTANGSLISAKGGNVTLNSTDNIAAQDIRGRNINLTAGNNIGAKDIYSRNTYLNAGNNIKAEDIYSRNTAALTAGNNIEAEDIHGRNNVSLIAGNNLKAQDVYSRNIAYLAAGNNIKAEDIYGKNTSLTAGNNIKAKDIYGRNTYLNAGNNIKAENIYGRNTGLTAGNNVEAEDIYGRNNATLIAGNNLKAQDVYSRNIAYLAAGNNIKAEDIYGSNISLIAGNSIEAEDIYGRNIYLGAGNNIKAEDIYGRTTALNAGNNIKAKDIYSRNTYLTAGTNITATGIFGRNIDLTAGDNILIGYIDAGNSGNVDLTAGAGVTGTTGGVIADNLDLNGTGTFTLTGADNNVGTLTADITGPLTYTQTGALTVDGITTGGGDVTLTTGALTLDGDIATELSLGGGTTVTLNTAGATGTGGVITDNLDLNGTGTFTLTGADNNVGTLTASITGPLTYTQTATGTLTVNGITTGNNNVTLSTGGNLILAGDIDAGNNNAGPTGVELTAAGVTGIGGVIARYLDLNGTGIFSLTGTDNNVSILTADILGPLTYAQAEGLIVNNIITGGNDVTLNIGAYISLAGDINAGNNAGSVTVDLIASGVAGTGGIIADNLYLNGTGAFSLTGADNDVGTLTANITTGPLTYAQTGILSVGIINAGTSYVNLTSSTGSILDAGSLITANLVTLTAPNGIGTNAAINTTANTIDANVTGTGLIDLNNENTAVGGVTLGSLTTANGNITVTADGTINVGSVDAGSSNVTLTATNGGSILNDASLITGNTINLNAANNIGATGNVIVTNSNFLNITAGGNIYLNATGVEIQNLNVAGSADLLTNTGTILDNITTGGDFTLNALTGDVTLNGTIQSTGGAVNLLVYNGSINANIGSTVTANANSSFFVPNGTIGITNPVNVNVTGSLIVYIGSQVAGISGLLTGLVVNGTTNIPTVAPAILTPQDPPGKVFFNGIQIWPPIPGPSSIIILTESAFALSQASSGLQNRFIFPSLEKLILTQVNTFDPTTSSSATGGGNGLFLYHPLTDVDSGAFTQEFQLDEGAYDFIDGEIQKKSL